MVSSDHIEPGEKGEIKATVNLKGKKGRIVKTIQVQTNDPKRSVVVLKLYATVKDPYHSQKYPPDEIFHSPCRRCHIDRGIGKRGGPLFWADCLMCHQRGKSGPPVETMKKRPEEEIFKAIQMGIPGTMMPGFSLYAGGPLTDAEIKSLVEYIKNR